MGKKRWLQKTDNVVLYTVKDEKGIHLHYSPSPSWTIYAGKKVIYRHRKEMAVIENAWEANPDVVNDVMCQLEAFTATGKSKQVLMLPVNGRTVPIRFSDALILWDDLRGMLPCLFMKKQGIVTAS